MREAIVRQQTCTQTNAKNARNEISRLVPIAEEGTNRGSDTYGEICARGIPNY